MITKIVVVKSFQMKLTISPFLNRGGSHDTMIFALDDGIALMLCGADGTVKEMLFKFSHKLIN